VRPTAAVEDPTLELEAVRDAAAEREPRLTLYTQLAILAACSGVWR
jgi:hypothetical protein